MVVFSVNIIFDRVNPWLHFLLTLFLTEKFMVTFGVNRKNSVKAKHER